MKRIALFIGAAVAVSAGLLEPSAGCGQEREPSYLRDRGPGIPTSIFGTYVRKGQFLVYPFYEFSLDHNREYQPAQLGFGLNQDFRGKYRDSREQIFIAYGVNDWLAVEFEAAAIQASLEKSPDDPSARPSTISESGISDIEGQLRFRLMREGERRPEIFGYMEITAASQKTNVLIGDPEWDVKPGLGVVKGFSWGTMTVRATLEYNRAARGVDVGEFSVEYLRRLSRSWTLYLGVEGGETGAPDEWELDTGIQWRIADFASVKIVNALGITSKAPDWALQIGCVFSFPSLNE
jgi:hypothetical protein